MAFQLLFCITIVILSTFFWHSRSADPDPLQDFCIADMKKPTSVNGFPCKSVSDVTSEDFFFDGLSMETNTDNIYGANLTRGDVLAFPGLNTLGISMNRVDLAPGGITPPHYHARATESGIVIQGKILVGMVTTDGNTLYSKVLSLGQMYVIPRGLMHFMQSVDGEKGLIFNAFNSQLPGSFPVPRNLFASKAAVPDELLAKAFQIDRSIVDEIRSKFDFV